MLCIHLKNQDPYFCLAAEEYFLKNFREDIFMLWQSEDTIVVGKHQNALGEINYRFVREKGIQVARRISGGGTVFHDSGNVNFTFIKNVKGPSEISFKIFTTPVVEALAQLGVTATTSGRNDLLINGFKISGNAEHVFKNRVLHHGTLLFNSDLENLGQAIKVIPGKYESKAVQSNRSPVANISSFLKDQLKIEEFIRFLIDFQLGKQNVFYYEFTDLDNHAVQKLKDDKFQNWEWNFGYSPNYIFRNEVSIDDKKLSVRLHVERGLINESKISGSNFYGLQNCFRGRKHKFLEIKNCLQTFYPDITDDFIYNFF